MHQDTKVAWGLYASNCSDVDLQMHALAARMLAQHLESPLSMSYHHRRGHHAPPCQHVCDGATAEAPAFMGNYQCPPPPPSPSSTGPRRRLLRRSSPSSLLQSVSLARLRRDRSRPARQSMHIHVVRAHRGLPKPARSCASQGTSRWTPTPSSMFVTSATLLWHLPLNAPMPDYVGRALSCSRSGSPLTYMQGGAFVLSRRAAAWLPQWDQGSGTTPNRVLRDVNTDRPCGARALCARRRTTPRISTWASQCTRHDQPLGDEPPVLPHHPEVTQHDRNLFRDMAERRIKRFCGCPVTVHPLKGRNLFEVRSSPTGAHAGGTRLPMSGRAKRSRARGALP